MVSSSADKEFVNYVIELMQSIGPVYAKSMFGGYGVFLDSLMFGLIADCVLYLKVDAETINDFKDRGLDAFVYDKKGKQFKMLYYQAPDEALEDGEEMSIWANKAYAVALNVSSKKSK